MGIVLYTTYMNKGDRIMNKQDEVYHKANVLMEMLYSAQKIPMWCFGANGRLYYTSCPYEQEFFRFLEAGGCLEYALSPERNRQKPVFLSDSLGLAWVADYMFEEEKPTLTFMLGPVFSSEISLSRIRDSLSKLNISLEAQRMLMQKLSKVPVVDVQELTHYGGMLRYVVTGETVLNYEFEYQGSSSNSKPDEYQDEDMEDADKETEYSWLMGPKKGALLEAVFMKAIRDGDIEFKLKEEEAANMSRPDMYRTKEVNRDEKNTVIIFIALCSRAAVEGGLSHKKAKELEVYFIEQAEKTKTLTELVNINNKMFQEFIQQVHDCKIKPDISKPVRECCDYIKRNLLKEIELKDIARSVGYSEYYLSKKFHKEMGMRYMDYIKISRIELAKLWLITTDKTIQEISDQMQFGSRSYFSKVFHDNVGMTPVEYRKRGMRKNP